MALIKYTQSISMPDGQLASLRSVTVTPLGGNVRVPLFADKAGQQPLTNPVTTDDFGQATFYADAGLYVTDFAGVQYTFPVDPAETDEAWPAKPSTPTEPT